MNAHILVYFPKEKSGKITPLYFFTSRCTCSVMARGGLVSSEENETERETETEREKVGRTERDRQSESHSGSLGNN